MKLIIVQTARSDIFKHIFKMISGKTDYIPFTFDNVNKTMSIVLLLDKISYHMSFRYINYLNIGFTEDIVIVPIKLQNLESIYKSIGSSKIKSFQLEYSIDDQDIEHFLFKCTITDSSMIDRNMDIMREDNMFIHTDTFEGYTQPVILTNDSIILFDRTICEIDKKHVNEFTIHYTDGYFFIKYSNLNPISFGFEWIKDIKSNIYYMSQSHICNDKCKEITISKNYCKKVFNKLKSINGNQINISFKYIDEKLTHIKINNNLDEIGELTSIINCNNINTYYD